MFQKLHKLIQNDKNLETNKICFLVFRDKTVQKIVIDLNRIDQLFFEGVKSDGSSLPLYSKATEAITFNKLYTFEGNSTTKSSGQPYTLFDTGDYYRSFRLLQDKTGFTILANDEKENGTLQEIYGNGVPILGLTDESKNKLSDEIRSFIVQAIRTEILRIN
jgi:hypothetical protein